MKTIITSDIHGCSLELRGLLRKCELNKEEDRLLILGDLFDRGLHSYEVFRQVEKLKAEMGERMIIVRGNHDQFFLENLKHQVSMALWAYNGGLKTLQSFENHGQKPDIARELLENTPLFFEDEQFIAVHAGLVSDRMEDNTPEILLWDRTVTEGGYKGKIAIGGHTPMRQPVFFMPDGNHLVLPYDARMSFPDRGFICIDTGCVFGGALTGLVIEGDRFWLKEMRKKDY